MSNAFVENGEEEFSLKMCRKRETNFRQEVMSESEF